MFENFPADYRQATDWSWGEFAPFAEDLLQRAITQDTIEQWLEDEGKLYSLIFELHVRNSIAANANTADEDAKRRQEDYYSAVLEPANPVFDQLMAKLLDSNIVPEDTEMMFRDLRARAEINNLMDANLSTSINKLRPAYNQITGNQQVEWQGNNVHVNQMKAALADNDRAIRERAFRLVERRQTEDRAAMDAIWRQYMILRKTTYEQTGMNDYRDYMWQMRLRFDYTPEDVLNFCKAIESLVVPVVKEIHDMHRQRLGVDVFKPWDVLYDGHGEASRVPFESIDDMLDGLHVIFEQIEPDFAGYFEQMRQQQLMDLEPRTNKYPYSYNEKLFFSKVPFIFYNAGVTHSDIVHIAHEFGHAFHNFEMAHLPYPRQHWVSMEFGEVPSTLMELLVTDHFDVFYDDADALKRARLSQLQEFMMEWPYVAMTVEFQHWIYTHHDFATDPANCDEKWFELWNRYMKGVDYSDSQDDVLNQWRHVGRLYFFPFYAVEYALAQVGSVQIWRNLAEDYEAAMRDFRIAMSLGNTIPLPELFEAAGAKLAFDDVTLKSAVDFIYGKMRELETV